MKLKVVALMVVFFLTFLSASAHAFKNEPDGYWGIKWGSKISFSTGIEWEQVIKYTYATNGPYGGRYMYKGKEPKLMPGGVIANEAYVDAATRKVYEIRMVAFGKENFDKIQSALVAKHGAWSYNEREEERHYFYWNGKHINLILIFNDQTQRISFSMNAYKIAAKEGVPADF